MLVLAGGGYAIAYHHSLYDDEIGADIYKAWKEWLSSNLAVWPSQCICVG